MNWSEPWSRHHHNIFGEFFFLKIGNKNGVNKNQQQRKGQ